MISSENKPLYDYEIKSNYDLVILDIVVIKIIVHRVDLEEIYQIYIKNNMMWFGSNSVLLIQCRKYDCKV